MEQSKTVQMTEDERIKCRKVMEAFKELYEYADLIVVEAGKYGFVKLQYYNDEYGFDEAISIYNSHEMFEDLWEEWCAEYLLSFAEGTDMADWNYEDIYECLPEQKKVEINNKKREFAINAEIEI